MYAQSFALALALPLTAGTQALTVTLADRDIELPVPDGFGVEVLDIREHTAFSPDDFARLRTMYRDDLRGEFDALGIEPGDAEWPIRHGMLTLMHAEVDETVTESYPLPVLLDNADAIAIGHVYVQRGPGDAPGQLAVDLASVAFIYVRERIVVVATETTYRDHDDVARFSAQLEEWVGAVVADNPRTLSDRFDGDITMWAFVALVALALIMVPVIWYIRR